MSAFDTPSLALGRLRPTGEIGSPFVPAISGHGFSAFDTPSLALGRLGPTG
ncbi:MAG: hypothetical protein HS111_23045 [Kofleriaceae bacterium]|nr:hypothetical protein [Kofleriaceae bacterium]